MQTSSEGPTKITKAVIDAAWRRRQPGSRVIIRDRDCRGLATDRELFVDGMDLRLPPAWERSPDRMALAEQDVDARQPKHAFAG
jgi:hypothetical protein